MINCILPDHARWSDLPDGLICENLSSPSCKNILIFRRPKSVVYLAAVPFHSEGRLAIVTDAGRDAVDAAARLTNGAEADGEVVWS